MELITCLVEGSQCHESPWPGCHFDEDFILVSEFSELEGPRPLLTIPEDGGGSFNKNSFTVRIMSVDCTAPISFDAGAEEGVNAFRTVGDTQVVLVEPCEGAVAYVHHFTLYDIHARGFVRPFCMAYVTHQSPKIMNNFTTFRDYFTRISSYFKFGNALVFLQDLRKRHEYLDYTKRKLLENDKPIGSCYHLPIDMRGFTFKTIEDSLKDSRELQNVMFAYLRSELFEEQKSHFDVRLENLLKSEDEIEPELEELDKKLAGVQPRSVGISSGRKFDAQLRTLADLSSPCKQEAFALLQKTYFLFRKSKYLDEIHETTTGMRTVRESHLNEQGKSRHSSTYSAMSKGFFLRPKSKCLKDQKCSDSDALSHFGSRSPPSASPKYLIPIGFHKAWDPSSQWSFSSWPARQNSFEVIRAANSSCDGEIASLKDAENWSLISTDPSIVSLGSAYQSEDLSDGHRTMESYPGTAKRIESLPTEPKNAVIINRQISKGSDDVDSTGSPSIVKSFINKSKVVSIRDGSESSFETNPLHRQNSGASFSSNKSTSSNTSDLKPVSGVVVKETGSASDIFDPPAEISSNVHGISLMNLRQKYPFFCHLVYSLMIGRPVVISGEKNNRQKVHCVIVSLLPCIPGFPVNKNSVVFWTTGPFHILNLATVKLVGLAKMRGQDPVPKSVLPYVTVLDYEDSTLSAPPYEGTYLNGIFDKQRNWPTASVFLESLHSAQIELSTQAFLMFSLTFADTENRGLKHESRQQQQSSPAMKINPERFFQFRFPPQDVRIIEHLVEVLKDNLRNSFHKALTGDESEDEQHGAFSCISQSSRQCYSETPNIKLNLMKCKLFTCPTGKKK